MRPVIAGPVLFIQSHHAEAGFNPLDRAGQRGNFARHVEAGLVRPVWDWDLTESAIETARGIITTIHLDQIRMADFSAAFERFLDRGGRLVFNGHIARPFIPELRPFVPVGGGRRADFELTSLSNHAVFEGIDRGVLQLSHGVAGFYGRGCNPMPEGARALTGVGERLAPVDWVWARPAGGVILSHAGNDWWGAATDKPAMARLADNLVRWANHETAA